MYEKIVRCIWKVKIASLGSVKINVFKWGVWGDSSWEQIGRQVKVRGIVEEHMLAWNRLKIEQRRCRTVPAPPVSVCHCVFLCEKDRHNDTETKRGSQPSVWLVQNGKYVQPSVLRAAASRHATITFSVFFFFGGGGIQQNKASLHFGLPEVKCRLRVTFSSSNPLLWPVHISLYWPFDSSGFVTVGISLR